MAKRPLHGIHSFIRSLTRKHCGLLATCGPCWHVSLPTSLIPGRSGGAGLGLLSSLPSLVPGTHSTDMVYDDE